MLEPPMWIITVRLRREVEDLCNCGHKFSPDPLMWHLSTCHFQYKYSEQRERDIEELQNELGRLREDYLG